MAFERNRATRPAAVESNDDWKAASFINVYLPSKDGQGRVKVGTLPLKLNSNYQRAIHERLTDGGEEALAAMKSKFILDFQSADAKPVAKDDLPF